MDLSVVIVNFNTKKLTADCLNSIYKYTKGVNFEIIVVDNASTDGSREFLKKKFPKITLIVNKDNLGFGRANNQAMKIANGEYIFLLNSDTYLIENSTKKLLEIAKSEKDVGIVAPLVVNLDKTIQQSVGYLPHLPQIFYWVTFLDDLPFGKYLKPYHVDHDSFYKKRAEVGWATGAAMFFPKTTFTGTGGFDNNIFMYGEDVEWCWRLSEQNLKIIFTPETKIIHIGRGSTEKISHAAFVGEFRGLIHMYKKYKGSFSLQILRLLLKIGALARIMIFQILGRSELAKVYVEAFKVA